MIALILETIDKCSQWKSMRHLAHLIGEESAARWNDMINYLYLLLGQYQIISELQYNYLSIHQKLSEYRYASSSEIIFPISEYPNCT
jgi:hypothetical protein